MKEHKVEFYMLARYEIPYTEVEHLLALPRDIRKMELMRIILNTVADTMPENRQMTDWQMNEFEKAMGITYWQIRKDKMAAKAEAMEAAVRNAIPAMEVL